jgi:hypothetical protein
MRAEFFGGSEMRRLVGRSERGGCCFTTRLAVTADTFPWQLAKFYTLVLLALATIFSLALLLALELFRSQHFCP